MAELFYNSSLNLFNDNWEFTAPKSDEAVKVNIPHSWNATGWSYENPKEPLPSGIGIYKKHIYGRKYQGCFLKFEGVCVFCEIYLNDRLIHTNMGAYKPFEVKLSELGDGDNILTVKVTDKSSVELLPENCDDVFSVSPRYKRWPVGFGSSLLAGGIWRNVYLVRKNAAYMEPFEIHSDAKGFYVKAHIFGAVDRCRVRYCIKDADNTESVELDASCNEFYIPIGNPVMSWPLRPHLYEFKAELTDENNTTIQTIIQPASLFDFTVRNSEFRINNKPYFLRGQNGFPHCNIAHDKEYIEKYVSSVKQQGVEISRFHTEPPSHEWLDECDRQGIMVILEMPIHGSYGCYSFASRQFQENALSEALAIVKEYRRHPSIVIWSMGNELIVSCERDAGLGKPLFDILEKCIDEVRKADPRPVISNSNGDAANIITKSVGDIDDVHQYGGWYTENLYDLRHFAQYTVKNDMLFQPCISTESIAGYTDNKEQFFIKHGDVRQKKVVAMRLGKIDDLSLQSRKYQQFMLKEYAEAMWRLRNSKSSFAGYIPFGQYTWFFNPFDKEKISPKPIWTTYRNVMSPVHVQLECFSRHIYKGESLKANLRLFNENICFENDTCFDVVITAEENTPVRYTFSVDYHNCVCKNIEIGPLFSDVGEINVDVYKGSVKVVHNCLKYRTYQKLEPQENKDLFIYDPENMLDIAGKRIEQLSDVLKYTPKLLLIGPYALDNQSSLLTDKILSQISNGTKVIVLEQNPGCWSDNIFNTGITTARVCQPQWSRWAMNLVKHADRMDICREDHSMFRGITEDDLFWWNEDTYLADSYLYAIDDDENDVIVSRIGNGLSEGELMPQKYEYRDSGYSISTIERKIGLGSILCTSLLIGSKCKTEPVARQILNNLIS